jgi:tetratricopeptide (TPR) repeat protein
MDLARLSVLFLSQAQYEQAQPYYERALLIEDQAQWSETPQVSVGLNHLARTAGNEGRHEEAEEIFEWALAVSESALGPDNANTVYLRTQYTQYLRGLGRDDEADGISNG